MTLQPAYDRKGRQWDGNYMDAIRRYYTALVRAGVNVDMVHPSQDLSRY